MTRMLVVVPTQPSAEGRVCAHARPILRETLESRDFEEWATFALSKVKVVGLCQQRLGFNSH